MEYEESVDRSGEVTRMVLPALSKKGLPVNPVTFGLFYEYFSGNSEPLRNILKPFIEGKDELTAKAAKELFDKHVINGQSDHLQQLTKELKEMMASIVQMVGNADGDVEKFSGSLSVYSGQLEDLSGNGSTKMLKDMVEDMLSEAREMLDSNRNFSQQLNSTSREIGLLRAELQDLRLQASQDTLTGLGNRKTFDEALNRALDSISTDMSTVCLMMLDIDNFKSINDEYGHLIGDKILRFIADILRRSVKGRDTVARFGGDEFGIILEETAPNGAYRLAENIRTLVDKSALKRTDTGEAIGNITVSIGVGCNKVGDTMNDLIHRADEALYESKKKGRNRVTCNMERPVIGS